MSDGESIAGREREVTFHTSSALTREQVEEVFNAVYWHGDQQGAKQCKVLDGIDALRATITQQAQEIERIQKWHDVQKEVADNQTWHVQDLTKQLAASQARCREMESKEIALKKHIELIQARLEHEVNRPSKLEDDIAQLQTTLTAREARIAELEDWQKIVLGSGTEQETVIRMAANEYTKTAVQCWKDHTKKIEAERDALRARVAELEAKYTTAKLVQRGVEEGEFWYWNDDEHDCLDSLLCPVVVLPEKINEWKQKLATVTAELEAFIAGGVTEELLRRQGGYLKVGKGCVLVREDDWDALLADHLGDANNKVCIWTENKDGQYETACGQMHEFFDGGPKDNHLQFCGYCGKGLIEQRWNL